MVIHEQKSNTDCIRSDLLPRFIVNFCFSSVCNKDIKKVNDQNKSWKQITMELDTDMMNKEESV